MKLRNSMEITEKCFIVFSYFIAHVMMEIDLCAQENRNKRYLLLAAIFLFHHQITINIYMCERFPICGELFMWVLHKVEEFTHACRWIVSEFSLLTMTKGNFKTISALNDTRRQFSTCHFKVLKNKRILDIRLCTWFFAIFLSRLMMLQDF